MRKCVCLFQALWLLHRKSMVTAIAILSRNLFFESVFFRMKSSTYKGLQIHALVTFVKPSFPNCNLRELGQKLMSRETESLSKEQKDIHSSVPVT